MDSDELRKMSIENARIAMEQANSINPITQIKEMETKDDLESGNYDWKDYLDTNGGDTYQSLMKEIELYIQTEARMKLTEDKRKGIKTLLAWVKEDNLYKIGKRTMEGSVIIDQLKKVLLLEQYDRMDKELLNELRAIYVGNPNGRMDV